MNIEILGHGVRARGDIALSGFARSSLNICHDSARYHCVRKQVFSSAMARSV